MTLRLEPVRVALEDGDGRLVFADDILVAVLVRLSPLHEDAAGRWFLESAYALSDGGEPTFTDLSEAETWIATRLATPPLR